jgi:hypothetical protein
MALFAIDAIAECSTSFIIEAENEEQAFDVVDKLYEEGKIRLADFEIGDISFELAPDNALIVEAKQANGEKPIHA